MDLTIFEPRDCNREKWGYGKPDKMRRMGGRGRRDTEVVVGQSECGEVRIAVGNDGNLQAAERKLGGRQVESGNI